MANEPFLKPFPVAQVHEAVWRLALRRSQVPPFLHRHVTLSVCKCPTVRGKSERSSARQSDYVNGNQSPHSTDGRLEQRAGQRRAVRRGATDNTRRRDQAQNERQEEAEANHSSLPAVATCVLSALLSVSREPNVFGLACSACVQTTVPCRRVAGRASSSASQTNAQSTATPAACGLPLPLPNCDAPGPLPSQRMGRREAATVGA